MASMGFSTIFSSSTPLHNFTQNTTYAPPSVAFNISNKIRSSNSAFLHRVFSLQSLQFPSFLLKSPKTAGIAYARAATEKSIHDFTVKDIDGNDVSLSKFKGKALLVVNVASKCGLTSSNYTELSHIYEKYKTQGLEILAFPCNQFGGQEPGSNPDIKKFACTRFKAEFPIFDKVDVNGPSTAPVYQFLKSSAGGFLGDLVKWNFEKFLVDKNGKVVERYPPTTSPFQIEGEMYLRRADVLKEKVRHLLNHMYDEKSPLALLQLIDDIQRIGLGHIFEADIRSALSFLKENNLTFHGDLHATALNFRLFREHGFIVSQDVFKVFKDPQGNFIKHLTQDVMGLISLYEASYFGEEGEYILVEAKAFVRRHLKGVKGYLDPSLAELVNHALNLPLNLRIARLEARWYIDAFSRRKDTNSNLLELAKLDYNMVQAAHQNDVINMSQWWRNLGLPEKLPFARDRLVECFLWSVGVAYEPQYKYCREGITKLCILSTTIDDIYDIYATIDEAKLFTDAVERWDVNAVEQLPDYMKICFLALYNTVNEMAYNTLKEQGLNIIPLLKKTVEDQCKSFLLEAKWFNTGYKPTLEEYLDNACISLGGPLVLLHSYFFLRPEVTKEALKYLESYPNLIRWSSMILRLADDMGTSKAELERGDVLKSVQCYMHHNDVTEEEAREHIRHLTDEAWKKMNAELWIDSPVPREFIKIVVNWAKTAETTYQYEDGHGVPDKETKSRVLSLLVDTIPV